MTNPPPQQRNVLRLLTAPEATALICLFVQHMGRFVLPRGINTVSHNSDFLALGVEPPFGEVSVRVAVDDRPLDKDHYANLGGRWLLFHTRALYQGTGSANVQLIEQRCVLAFLHSAKEWLPAAIRDKYERARSIHE